MSRSVPEERTPAEVRRDRRHVERAVEDLATRFHYAAHSPSSLDLDLIGQMPTLLDCKANHYVSARQVLRRLDPWYEHDQQYGLPPLKPRKAETDER